MARTAKVARLPEIRLLGELTVLWEGCASVLPSSRKARALLAYLVATGGPQPRETLCDLLWDGPSDPRAELRWCLSKLRPLLEADGVKRLVADREHAAFQRDGATVDIHALEGLLAGALGEVSIEALVEAVRLFRGDFLAGLAIPDSYRFQSWLVLQREAYRAKHLQILGELVQRTRHRPLDALPYARAFVATDAEAETGHLLVMGLLDALGRKREALKQYETYKKILETQLGARPSLRMERARMALGSGEGQDATDVGDAHGASRRQTSSASWPPLVGRRAELSAIARTVDATVSSGRQRALVLTGQPGIGKTRLLEELATQMTSAGGLTLMGRGFEAEMTRPYGAWVDAIRALPPAPDTAVLFPDLTILLPELGVAAAGTLDRNRLFEAVAGFLTRLADQGPLAIALDDLHWLDEGSAALLHYVARRLRERRVLLACAARPGELVANAPAWRVLRALRAEPGTHALTVGPLDRSATTDLVRALDADVDPDQVFAESQGNSLFALEVARALSEHGTGLSDSLEGIIADRVAGVGDKARNLIGWAACLGGTVRLDVLVRASGQPAADVLSAVEDLERRAILRVIDGDAYEFAHDVTREVAYRQLAEPRRRFIHAEIARVLSELRDPDVRLAVEVAHHADLGGVHALAATAAAAAGQKCLAVFANAEALAVVERGLVHLERLDREERLPARVSLLTVRALAGLSEWRTRMPDLASDLERAVDEAREAGLHEVAARGHFVLSVLYERDDLGRTHRETLLAAEDARAAEPAATARQLANTGQCLAHIQRDMGRARAFLQEAQRLAKHLHIQIADVELGFGIVAVWDGQDDLALAQLQSALRIFRQARDRYSECKCLIYLARLELDRSRPEHALANCAELIPVASGMGEGNEAPVAAALEALAHVALGTPESEQRLRETLGTLGEIDAQTTLAYALNLAAKLDLDAGRMEASRRHAERALQAAERVGRTTETATARTLLARIALASGQRRAARAHLESVLTHAMDRDVLSARARTELQLAAQQLELVIPAIPSAPPTEAPMDVLGSWGKHPLSSL